MKLSVASDKRTGLIPIISDQGFINRSLFQVVKGLSCKQLSSTKRREGKGKQVNVPPHQSKKDSFVINNKMETGKRNRPFCIKEHSLKHKKPSLYYRI